MKHKIELLAPGGDINAMKTAIFAGANAIYCGLNKFNARNRAANISFEDLQGILSVAHEHHCKVFLTLNIVFLNSEIPFLVKLLTRIVNTSIDGIIVQDLGLFYIINKYFPSLKIHASTQLTTHNEGQIKFLGQLQAERINLSRELSITEIKQLTDIAHSLEIKTEVFIHGSYCISFSGLCYMSSLLNGNSGNRGQCSQPCRERYLTTPAGNEYPLNLKDNSAYFDFKELYEAHVDSLKIEGRIKESEYVYTIVNAWRKQIDTYLNEGVLLTNDSALYKVFNRDFSNGFLKNKISKAMFIDNPMNHAIHHLKEENADKNEEGKEEKLQQLYEEKSQLRTYLNKEIAQYDTKRQAVNILISGEYGTPLTIDISTPQQQFSIISKTTLSYSVQEALTKSILTKRLKAIDEIGFYIQEINYTLKDGLYLPYKELTTLKKHILYTLNGNQKVLTPITLPKLEKQIETSQKPTLSILISDIKEMDEIAENQNNIYIQLPNSFKDNLPYYISLFKTKKQLIPWFPAVIIGDDYTAALDLLEQIHPLSIVTNNTGIAYEAFSRNIPWLAGPQLNITNTYSLLNLQENFNCKGAFLSNELSKRQIFDIKKPKDFELHYMIFEPITLMTSRQCLFQQISTCSKHILDDHCISHCAKQENITNLKGQDFIIEKSLGNYHRIFNETHLLNTEIARDYGHQFESFTIDLSTIKNKTQIHTNNKDLVLLFQRHIAGDKEATKQLHTLISPTNNKHYQTGI